MGKGKIFISNYQKNIFQNVKGNKIKKMKEMKIEIEMSNLVPHKSYNFYYNYLMWQAMIGCLSLSCGSITFSSPLTVCHIR